MIPQKTSREVKIHNISENKVCISPQLFAPEMWLPPGCGVGVGEGRQVSKSTTKLPYRNLKAFCLTKHSLSCCKIFIKFQSSEKDDFVNFHQPMLIPWKDQFLELLILPYPMTFSKNLLIHKFLF